MVRFLAAIAALAAPAAATSMSMSHMLQLTAKLENAMAATTATTASSGMDKLREAFDAEITTRSTQIKDLEAKIAKKSSAIQKNKETKAAKNANISSISAALGVHNTQKANKEEKLKNTRKVLETQKSAYVVAMAARTDTAQKTAAAAAELKSKSDTIAKVQKEIETNLASTLSADTLDSVKHIMTQLLDANKAAMVNNDKEESLSRRSMSEHTLRWSTQQKNLHKSIQNLDLNIAKLARKIAEQNKDLTVNKDELKLAGEEQITNEDQLENARNRLEKTKTSLGMVRQAKKFITQISGEIDTSAERAA